MLVPTRELGVQIALLVYRLFGGNPTATAGIPGQPGNMFRYSGPRGLQVGRSEVVERLARISNFAAKWCDTVHSRVVSMSCMCLSKAECKITGFTLSHSRCHSVIQSRQLRTHPK